VNNEEYKDYCYCYCCNKYYHFIIIIIYYHLQFIKPICNLLIILFHFYDIYVNISFMKSIVF
jgi:hypothetical protein